MTPDGPEPDPSAELAALRVEYEHHIAEDVIAFGILAAIVERQKVEIELLRELENVHTNMLFGDEGLVEAFGQDSPVVMDSSVLLERLREYRTSIRDKSALTD